MSAERAVVQVGVDHTSAPLAVIEVLHRALREAPAADLRSRCGGVVRLATCHRVELYTEGATPQVAAHLYCQWLRLSESEAQEAAPHLVVRSGADAAEHLMSVAAGLESAVLGEDQIQGQVREAYRAACAAGDAGPLLHRLFHAALRAGRRARSETPLKQGGRSLAGSAIAWLARELGDLRDETVLVIGAGEMARVAAARLREREVGRLLIINRTWSKAQELAAATGGEALPWAWRERVVGEVGGIVCATGAPEPVIRVSWLQQEEGRCRGPRLVVVDLAVPRNVEQPAEPINGVLLADVEGLSRRLAEDADRREGAVLAARAIVAEGLESWVSWVRARGAGVGGSDPARRGSAAG
jgi:glutamyl-tRNA reductase